MLMISGGRLPANFGAYHCRIDPPGAVNALNQVMMDRGTQIVRVPRQSMISSIRLAGGAPGGNDPAECHWAALRGGVLKFAEGRREPALILGDGFFTIPTGHTLMDRGNYDITVKERNGGQEVPFRLITELSQEPLFLVPTSFCHPQNLFLPKGAFPVATFSEEADPAHPHRQLINGILKLNEEEIGPIGKKSINILETLSETPRAIEVRLKQIDGRYWGTITLENSELPF